MPLRQQHPSWIHYASIFFTKSPCAQLGKIWFHLHRSAWTTCMSASLATTSKPNIWCLKYSWERFKVLVTACTTCQGDPNYFFEERQTSMSQRSVVPKSYTKFDQTMTKKTKTSTCMSASQATTCELNALWLKQQRFLAPNEWRNQCLNPEQNLNSTMREKKL